MPFHKVFFRLFPVLVTVFFSFLVVLSSLIVRNAVQLKFPPKTRVGLMISRQNAEYSTVISCATFHSGLHIGGGRSRPPWEAAILLVSTKDYLGITLVNSLKVTMQFLFLCSDICSAFGAQVHPYLEKQAINELLQEGRRSKTHKTKQVATWATKELRKLKQQQVSYIVIWFLRNAQV